MIILFTIIQINLNKDHGDGLNPCIENIVVEGLEFGVLEKEGTLKFP